MAKGEYQKWLEPENLLMLQGWKLQGLTDEQVAGNIGINPRTLEKWKSKYGQIRQALNRGKMQANFTVENRLLKKAIDGDNTAMIFFLKNNYREKYSDSQKTPEETALAKAQARKAEAEARLAEYKAKLLADPSSIEDKVIIIDDFSGGEDNQEIKNKSDN